MRAVGVITLMALSACFTAPELGEAYECTGVFICYGDHFGVRVSGCAEDEEEAVALATESLEEQLVEAKCGDERELHITCKSIGKCVKE